MTQDGVTEWSWGVPLAGERSLEGGEREVLRAWAVRMRFLSAASWVSLGTAWFVFALCAQRADPASAAQQNALGGTLLVLMLGALPLAIIGTRYWLARSSRLVRDVRGGVVKCYHGPFDNGFHARDSVVLRLSKDGLLPVGPSRDWSIEVLPASRRVWRIDGKAVRAWVEAPSTQLARTPAFSALAADWLEPVGRVPEGRIMGGRREMSEPEREELLRHARRAWVRPFPWAVGMTAWLLLPFVLLGNHLVAGPDSIIRWALVGALALSADSLLVRGLVFAKKVGRDRSLGHVMILRLERGTADPAEAPRPATTRPELDEEPIEVLPASGLVWTENGHPSAWRKIV